MFSAPLMFRDKAQCATNGCSISKRCDAVARHQGSAHWVSLSAPMDCVAPLGKGTVIPGKARLAMHADKLTEYDDVTLQGHSAPCC